MTEDETRLEQTLVSLLVPCYNHEDYVISTLESIAASDHHLLELIFIDDGSKDNSYNLAENWFKENKSRFVRAVCLKHEKNRGICKTLNELHSLSRGTYICFLASDDLLLANAISKQVGFSLRQGLDFLFSDCQIIDESGNLISDSALQYFGKNSQRLSNKFCLITDIIFAWNVPWNKFFMKSSFFEKIGCFDESLCFEDRDFIVRTLINGSFEFIPDTTTAYRLRSKEDRLTPGLNPNDLMGDFRKADCKNYLTSSGITRLLLSINVYSYEEKYSELGIKNTIFIWVATGTINLLRRLIFLLHLAFVRKSKSSSL